MAGHPLDYQAFPDANPTGAPQGDFEHIQSSPEMFGGLIGKAEETLGAGVTKAADTGLEALVQRQTMQNDIHAASLNSWYADRVTDRFSKFSQLQGSAALRDLPNFKSDIDGLRQDAMGQAGSLQEKAKLAAGLRYLQDAYYRYGTNHADQQFNTYAAKTTDDQIRTYGNLASIAFVHGDDATFNTNLNLQDNEVRNSLELKGYDHTTIEAEVAKRRGATLKNTIESAFDSGDPNRATALFAKYKDQMDPESRLSALKFVNSYRQKIQGTIDVDAALSTLGPVIRGDVGTAINNAAKNNGLDPNLLSRVAKIESGFNPNAKSGSYSGLFQMSADEFQRYGGGDINNPTDNANAAARKMAAETKQFQDMTGTAASPGVAYLIHQQGLAGTIAHLNNPDAPAWQNMQRASGRSEAWSKQAIWGNIPNNEKDQFPGGVESVTSGQFTDLWKRRVETGTSSVPSSPYYRNDGDAIQRIMDSTEGDPLRRNAALSEYSKRFSLIDGQMRKQIAQDNHDYTMATRARTEEQKQNFGDLMADIESGKTPDNNVLVDMLRTQRITPEQHRAIMTEARRLGRGDDDSETVIDLQRRINSHEDVTNDIAKAMENNLLTGKTALRLTKLVGGAVETPLEKSLYEEIKTIGNAHAIETGVINLGNENGQIAAKRWGAMQNEWTDRVKMKREDPVKVRDDMVKRWAPIVDEPRTWPRPTFTTEFVPSGKIANEDDLNKVAVGTYQKYQAKLMSEDAYNRDVALLNQYREYYKTHQPASTQPEAIVSGRKAKVIGRQPEGSE